MTPNMNNIIHRMLMFNEIDAVSKSVLKDN